MIDMFSIPQLDKNIGIEVYVTKTPGIGGKIRQLLEDFIVEEISKEGIRVRTSLTSKENEVKLIGSEEGDYTWFILEKRNLDTITALKILAKQLGVNYNLFSVAGLKDSKAITAQLVSAFNIPPERLISFKDKYGNIRIRKCIKRPFRLIPGMLYGNYFIITIRKINLSNEEINERISKITEEISQKYIPAFYGYQRFGTIRPNTHIIGKYILSGKFEDAVMELVAHPYPSESDKLIELREFIKETRNFKRALEKFPRSLSHERIVLKHLSKRNNDYIGALRKLPLSVRRLFISAYQAYLFNKCLSTRIKRGLPINRVVIGDLVASRLKDGSLGSVMLANEKNIEYLNDKIARGDMVLVLNVLGYGSIIHEGPQGDIEREVLKNEGISLDIFRSRYMPEVATKGTYRIASFLPENMKISLPMIDELNKGYRKVIFEFTLRKGLYATILLREYMKPKDIIAAGF